MPFWRRESQPARIDSATSVTVAADSLPNLGGYSIERGLTDIAGAKRAEQMVELARMTRIINQVNGEMTKGSSSWTREELANLINQRDHLSVLVGQPTERARHLLAMQAEQERLLIEGQRERGFLNRAFGLIFPSSRELDIFQPRDHF